MNTSITKYCVDQNISVRDAMKAIDCAEPQIVFLVDDRHLVASLTDGDIRRFLLKGGSLDDAAIEAANNNPLAAKNETAAANMYHERNFVAIPIEDDEGNIVDIYIGAEVNAVQCCNLDIPVVINAGGRGTRLEPYTKILPKPLIPVGELPIIEHIMQRFIKYGCTDFHAIVNYKKELIKAYFADSDSDYSIRWYDESKPLGTGGGLCYLKGKIDQTFFLSNCDNLLFSNYDSMLRFHRKNENMITMVCAYKNFTIPYGVVDMGIDGTIESMKEKPELSFLTNTGIYIVEPMVLDYIEDDVSIGFPDIVQIVKEKGMKVAVYPVSEQEWLDMGQLSELENMRHRLYGE